MEDMTVGCETLILQSWNVNDLDAMLNHVLHADHRLYKMIWFSYADVHSTDARLDQPLRARSVPGESGAARFHGAVHDQFCSGSCVPVLLFEICQERVIKEKFRFLALSLCQF